MKNMILGIAALLILGLLVAFSILPGESSTADTPANDKFQTFLKQFPKATLPYAISKEQMLEQLQEAMQPVDDESANIKDHAPIKIVEDPDRFISSNRLEYVSRVPTYKEPVAQFATKQHHAVIYVVSQGFGRPFRSYHIAVFDKTGKRLATHSLANAGRSYLTASTINENLEAVCSMYQVNWASDVDEVSLEENSITGLTLERSENIDLTKPSEDDFNLQKLKLKQPEKKEEKVKTIGAVFN